MIGAAGCEPSCESVVEADTGIASDQPVRLRVSWCVSATCSAVILDSDGPSPQGTFQLSDRDGRWLVSVIDPILPREPETVALEIADATTGALVIRATATDRAVSDEGCLFLSVAAAPSP